MGDHVPPDFSENFVGNLLPASPPFSNKCVNSWPTSQIQGPFSSLKSRLILPLFITPSHHLLVYSILAPQSCIFTISSCILHQFLHLPQGESLLVISQFKIFLPLLSTLLFIHMHFTFPTFCS